MVQIEPCRDDEQMRAYIDEHWRKGHILARDPRMFDFQYRTPWVDRSRFPNGTSIFCAYQDDDLVGFIGAIAAPYPRKLGYWLALWHVLEKGAGLGGRLLLAMEAAAAPDGWIGTFGAGSEAVPVYMRFGYAVRAVRRWVFDPSSDYRADRFEASLPELDVAWARYRYDQHPVFTYQRSDRSVSRTEDNEWGRVTHLFWFEAGTSADAALYEEHRSGAPGKYLMDYWSFEWPGPGWELASKDLPSVFHPPAARGNSIYASAKPIMPAHIGKGDCDQDRPN